MNTGSIILIAYVAIAAIAFIGLAIREWRMQKAGLAPPGPLWQGIIVLGCMAILWWAAGAFIAHEWYQHHRNRKHRGR